MSILLRLGSGPGIEAVLVTPPALLLRYMDQLQSDSVLLPSVAVVYVEYHDGQIIVVVIFLLVRVVLLPPPGQEGRIESLLIMNDISDLTRSPTGHVLSCWCTTLFLP